MFYFFTSTDCLNCDDRVIDSTTQDFNAGTYMDLRDLDRDVC